jgi:hypothetical protein
MIYLFPLLHISAILLTIFENLRLVDRTRRDARELGWIVLIISANFFITPILYRLGGENWLEPQLSVLILELVTLGLLGTWAVRSRNYWPLLVGGLHIPVVLSMIVTVTGRNITSYGLGVTQGLWGYFQLLIIIAIALRLRSRRRTPAAA